MNQLHLALILAAAAALGSCASASADQRTPADLTPATIDVTEAMGSPHPGDLAPDFTLTDQHGAPLSLSSLRGNAVVLSFVASWCPYSAAEQQHLATLPTQYQGKPVRFVIVDVQEGDAGYRKYLERVVMPMPVVHDADGKVTESFVAPGAQPGVKRRTEVPIAGHVVIDANGVIRAIHMANLNRFDAELTITRATLDRVLAEGT
ncbi:MAG: TlpA family protein disulfide reductase [Deltaproteobacteria bacterium]|nr:TlpA family protein disulfide reductase [Deltaproteobacteria bacterium]